jgi:hypothetical protein
LINENSWNIDPFWVQFTHLYDFLNLSDSNSGSTRHIDIAVTGSQATDHIAPAVSFVALDKGEIAFYGMF